MNVIRYSGPSKSHSNQPSSVAGFDWLRVVAALAVVALHASVPYLKNRMPGLVWPVWDSSSQVVDSIFWSIEVVVMPLFLVMAGFLLWRSSQRLSPQQLVRTRAKRLLIPLAFGILVILPIDLYVWTAGLVAEGVVPVAKFRSLKFDTPRSEGIWGLGHLWFLLYVFLYVVVAASLLKFAATHNPVSRFARTIAQPKILIAVLLSTAIVTLLVAPEVVWGFQHAFVPVPSKWIYSGIFFAAGCGLAFHDNQLIWVSKATPRMLAIGIVLLTSSVALGTWSLGQLESGNEVHHAATFLLAILTVTAATAVSLGLIGACAAPVKTVPKTVRYLAGASFWIYLVHHPLLGLIHTDIKWIWPQGSPLVKLCVSFLAAIGISVLLYEAFIRQSRFGMLIGLDGSAKPKPSVDEDDHRDRILKLPLPAVEVEKRRAA